MKNAKPSADDVLSRLTESHLANTKQMDLENHFLREIVDITRRITIEDLNLVLRRIILAIVKITRAEQGFILLCDKEGDELNTLVGLTEQPIDNTDSAISHSIAREVIRTGKGLLIENVTGEKQYSDRASIAQRGIKAVMCVPVKNKEKIFAVIYVDSRREEHNFSHKDLHFFEVFAAQAAIAIENAQWVEHLKKENTALRRNLQGQYSFGELKFASAAMKAVIGQCQFILDNNVTVLINGESGTGKELLARAVHYNGLRREKPFIPVNCSAIPDNLLESELFGYRKEAFTGASEDRDGLFKAAHQGTIFLDEISETTPDFQKKLLRVLENRTIRRIGDTREQVVDVRIIAATNKDLVRAVGQGTFREDLYYRLAVFPLTLPPLRDRTEDIPLLVSHFILQFNRELGKKIQSLPGELLDRLQQQAWKGNVRELKNYVHRLMLVSRGYVLEDNEKSPVSPETTLSHTPAGTAAAQELLSLAALEKSHILRVLDHTSWNISQAARILRIPRTTLLGKMNKLGLHKTT